MNRSSYAFMPFNKNKIFSYYKEAKLIQKGEIPNPRMALIYPSYACNHKCPGCHYKDWNDNHKRTPYIDKGKFIGLLMSLGCMGTESIEFCGGGEPLMHPQFDSLVRLVGQYNFKFGLFTNGSLLSKRDLKGLLNVASYIRISIDGEVDWAEIRNAVKTRDELKADCYIGTKILVDSQNLPELNNLVMEALKAGADYVQVKPAKPTRFPIYALKQEELVSDFYNLKDKYHRVMGSLENTYLRDKCWLSPIHTMIDVYGDVYICCYYQFRDKTHKIGNVFEEEFKFIWGSERHREVIKNIKNKECNIFDCRWHKYNEMMSNHLKYGNMEFC